MVPRDRRRAGGIHSVTAFIQENGGAIEADLQRHYGIAFSDFFTVPKRLSWRRLNLLLEYLPADSATRRLVNPEGAGWGVTEHLLAAAVDTLRGANWQRGGGKGSKPKALPRPGLQGPRTETHGHVDRPPQEVDAYLKRFAPSMN